MSELLAQLADKNVDDLKLGLVDAAVKVVEEHLFRERRALAQGKQLKHLIFFAREMHALAVDLHGFRVEINPQVPV